MATVITQAFEHWNASQVMNGLAARPNKIVFAFIPGLDPSADIDRQAPLPAAEHIVYQAPITQYGLINENAVAYSVVLDTFIGDFDFNYLGLVHEESGTLCMVVHTLTQSKIATAAGQQGNSFTRTFLMEFNGAAESSQITVNAETWQIDYSARLAGIDESVRLSNFDYYGPAAFIGAGFKVTKEADQYRISSGVGYVGGLRVELADDLLIDIGPHGSVWLDVALKGTVTGAHIPDVQILLADELTDYVDSAGFKHYVAKLAIEENAVVEDVRPLTPQEQITGVIDEHEKSRNHPAATLKDKGLVSLSNSVTSASQTEAATPKAVKTAYDLASEALTAANETARNAAQKSTTINGKPLSSNIILTSQDIFSNQAIVLGENKNLNTYITAGLYVQTHNVNTSLALNYPETQAGALVVYQNAGVTQVYYVYNSSRTYSRGYNSGIWTAWAQDFNTLNVPTLEQLGITKNTASKAANGWWRCGDTGVIKQWGIAAAADNNVVIANLPIAFPNTALSLNITVNSAVANTAEQVMSAYGAIVSKSQIKIGLCSNWANGAGYVFFEVKGY